MTKGSITSHIRRWSIWAVLAGATLAQVPGCDPNVQKVLVTGMQSATTAAASAIIGALFQTITPDGEDALPIVMNTLHQALSMLA